jgi:hypothetical protein
MKKTPTALLVFLLFISCEKDEDPNYPVEPFIEFRELSFINGETNSGSSYATDTIALIFRYRDGDADLGLNQDPADLKSPYHSIFLFTTDAAASIEKINTTITESDIQLYISPELTTGVDHKLITLATRQKQGYGFLPDFSCSRYMTDNRILLAENQLAQLEFPPLFGEKITIGTKAFHLVSDNFLFETNPDHYTIDVDFLIEQPDGSFKEFDWSEEFCSNFNGRFPRIPFKKSGPFTSNSFSKSTGEIRYTMPSAGFRTLFGGQNLKLRVVIRDRALHKSNTMESDAILIPEK